jgi:hypothetical protein
MGGNSKSRPLNYRQRPIALRRDAPGAWYYQRFQPGPYPTGTIPTRAIPSRWWRRVLSGLALALQTSGEVRCTWLEAIAAAGRLICGAYLFWRRAGYQPGKHNCNVSGFTIALLMGPPLARDRRGYCPTMSLTWLRYIPDSADGSSFSWQIIPQAARKIIQCGGSLRDVQELAQQAGCSADQQVHEYRPPAFIGRDEFAIEKSRR